MGDAMLHAATVVVFGLALGSFLNVCIYRLPREESVVTPRSHCPRCGSPIRWFHNIPLLSYLVLRGRCRNCREPISPLYPLVEALTAALLLLNYTRYGLNPEFVKYAFLSLLLLVLVFTDLTHRRIPHPVTLLGTGVGLALSLFVPVDSRPAAWLLRRFDVFVEWPAASFLGALSGALFGGGLLYVVGEAFYRLRHKAGLGFGDVMLMLMIGTYLGVPLTLLTMLLGSLLGSLIAVGLHVASPRFRNYEWPFGSFLGIAGIYALLGGSTLLDAYLRWAGLG